ncbi:MAG TPA: site-specific integrase [Polyangiaceae bacterium]|nr:site-specific integrase [Polyangiaceae bacterium]
MEGHKKKRKRSYGTGSIYKRGRYYWIAYYVRGKEIRESSRSGVHADAFNLLNQRRAEIKARGNRQNLKPSSFGDLAELLRADYEQKQRKSLKRAEQCIAHLHKAFKNDLATDITYERMSAYFNSRSSEGAAPATIRQELAILGRMFTLAVKAGRIASRPSIPTIEFDNVRTGFLEDAEIKRVIEHLPDHLKPLVLFLAVSGWRTSEARGLTWADVDWNEGAIRLAGARLKNGRPRVFPFSASPTLADVLSSQWEATQALQRESGAIVSHVFHKAGRPIRDFRDSWSTACREAGVPGRLCHDLRRSAVRRFEQRGIPRSVAMQITGHRTEAIYKRYAVTSPADVSDALAKLDLEGAESKIRTRPAQSTGAAPADKEGEVRGGA